MQNKTLGLVMALGLAAWAPSARADEVVLFEGQPHNIFDINPLSLIFGKLSLEYEGDLGPAATLLIGPQIQFYQAPVLNNATSGTSVQGYGLNLGLHFFPGVSAPTGFWIGPETQLMWDTGSLAGVSASGAEIQLNGVIGYTFMPAPHLAIALGVGAGAVLTNVRSSDNSVVVAAQGFDLTGRAAIGYAW